MEISEQLIQRATEIIQEQCNEDGYCALTLMDTDNRPNTTTITPSKSEGIQWMTFCTGYGTRTERIQFRSDACVCFNSSTYHISLKGKMEIINDPAVKKEMWYQGLANHFSGPEDPNYVVLKFIADSYTLFIDWQSARGTL
jgi:general stress protein 26